MTVQNLTTARFVLQCLHEELEEYDRCIPVARNLQVGDVADALAVLLNDRRFLRLTVPEQSPPRRRRMAGAVHGAVAKRKARVSCTA
jgi:hypothetical protein